MSLRVGIRVGFVVLLASFAVGAAMIAREWRSCLLEIRRPRTQLVEH
jgi:hypothetical protein